VRNLVAVFTAAVLTGCALLAPPRANVPPFAQVPYQPISRGAIVAIAKREWRLFGSRVDDGPDQMNDGNEKPEREEGLWQRVGEYWWEGMTAGAPESGWTGKHDEKGSVFPPDRGAEHPWSAAFVSYVMRIAGAGKLFPYSPDHARYIDIAKRVKSGAVSGFAIVAERPDSYAPEPGDLLCFGRDEAGDLTYDDLPVGHYFPAHCEFVVDISGSGTIAAIGGNDRDAVVLRHIAGTQGMLASPPFEGGHWLAILRFVGPTTAESAVVPGVAQPK